MSLKYEQTLNPEPGLEEALDGGVGFRVWGDEHEEEGAHLPAPPAAPLGLLLLLYSLTVQVLEGP